MCDCVLPTRIARNGTAMTSKGKVVFGTLRRCIAAWLYFKLYRMGGAAKKLGCKVCSKLAGGDLNVS